MKELKIVYLPPGDLTPYQRNAKQHPEKQVQHIANSIREFGFRQPIVVDADNVVVIGHGRLLAAKKLGLDAVPVVRADDLTDEQIKALRLADNKTNESEWDFGDKILLAGYYYNGRGKNSFFGAVYTFTTDDHSCEGEIRLTAVSDEFFADNGHAIAWAMAH